MTTTDLLPPVTINRTRHGDRIACGNVVIKEVPSAEVALDTLVDLFGDMHTPDGFEERNGPELTAICIAVIREALMKGKDEKDNGTH